MRSTALCITAIENNTYVWGGQGPSWQQIYYWYYETQAKFQADTNTFRKWNNQMAPALVKSQVVERNAYAGPNGKSYDIGHWEAQTAAGVPQVDIKVR